MNVWTSKEIIYKCFVWTKILKGNLKKFQIETFFVELIPLQPCNLGHLYQSVKSRSTQTLPYVNHFQSLPHPK
jgi:hypothetical protein